MNADVLSHIAGFCGSIDSRLALGIPPKPLKRNKDLDRRLVNIHSFFRVTRQQNPTSKCLPEHWEIQLNREIVAGFGRIHERNGWVLTWKSRRLGGSYNCHWGERVDDGMPETVTACSPLGQAIPAGYERFVMATFVGGNWVVRMEDNCLVPSDCLNFRKHSKVLRKFGFILDDS
jgi:hypothetical protein